MKFTDGTWQSRPGWRLHHPQCIQEYRLEPDGIRLLALCKPMRVPGDLTDAVSLEYSFTAPRPDMIRVRVAHFIGSPRRGPEFTLDTVPGCGRAFETDRLLVLESGDARLEIEKQGVPAFRFYYRGRLLTQTDGLGAYVADADYEAHRAADVNRRELPRGCDART